jgi:hypothetical protein
LGVSDTLHVEVPVTEGVDDNDTDAVALYVGVGVLVPDRVDETEIVCVAVGVRDLVGPWESGLKLVSHSAFDCLTQ